MSSGWRQGASRRLVVVSLVALGLATMECRAAAEDGSGEGIGSERMDHVVIIGASYAKGWRPLHLGGLPVVNVGAGGEQSHELFARFERDVVHAGPRAVVIWGFINDFFRTERHDVERTKQRIRDSFEAMVNAAREQGIVPILATEVTVRTPDSWTERLAGIVGRVLGKPSYQQYINGRVVEVNNWLKDYAVREGLLVLDFQGVLAGEDGMRALRYAAPDGSHISEEGYNALSEYAGKVLPDFR